MCDDSWDTNDANVVAASWAVAGPFQPQEVPGSVSAQGPLSWTTWAVQGMRPTCGAAPTTPGTHTTADTTRTPASSAQVGLNKLGVLLWRCFLAHIWILSQSTLYISLSFEILRVFCLFSVLAFIWPLDM